MKSDSETNMMVGQSTVTNKPSRSDAVLDADEQLKIATQIRAQFDALAPKRPIKPNRSEPDPFAQHQHPVDSTLSVHTIPELDKFHSLQSQSPVCKVSLSLSALNYFCFFFSFNTKKKKKKEMSFGYAALVFSDNF